jgi:hypothetical protein
MTSEVPARARIAVISPPPSVRVRRAKLAVQSRAAGASGIAADTGAAIRAFLSSQSVVGTDLGLVLTGILSNVRMPGKVIFV